jgi:hypothetical protein
MSYPRPENRGKSVHSRHENWRNTVPTTRPENRGTFSYLGMKKVGILVQARHERRRNLSEPRA